MHVEVRSVTEDSSSAAAVAQLKDDLKADSFIVLSGDLVSDVPLKVHTTADLCFLTNCQGLCCPSSVMQTMFSPIFVV